MIRLKTSVLRDNKPSRRGEALGTAIMTLVQSRAARISDTTLLDQSCRFVSCVCSFGTIEVLMVCAYFFPGRTLEAQARNDILLSHLYDYVAKTGMPFIPQIAKLWGSYLLQIAMSCPCALSRQVAGAGCRCWCWCCELAVHVVGTGCRCWCWCRAPVVLGARRAVVMGAGRRCWCCELAVHVVGTGCWWCGVLVLVL